MKIETMVNIQGFQTALESIRGSEEVIKTNLNEWGPLAVAGILAGDNVKHANDLIQVFGGVRSKRMTTILGKFLPYKRDKETGLFTEKDKNEKLAAKKLAAFEAFCASEETMYGLLENQKAVEKAQKSPEEKRKAALAALNRAMAACSEAGVDYESVQSAAIANGYTLGDVMRQLKAVA